MLIKRATDLLAHGTEIETLKNNQCRNANKGSNISISTWGRDRDSEEYLVQESIGTYNPIFDKNINNNNLQDAIEKDLYRKQKIKKIFKNK